MTRALGLTPALFRGLQALQAEVDLDGIGASVVLPDDLWLQASDMLHEYTGVGPPVGFVGGVFHWHGVRVVSESHIVAKHRQAIIDDTLDQVERLLSERTR